MRECDLQAIELIRYVISQQSNVLLAFDRFEDGPQIKEFKELHRLENCLREGFDLYLSQFASETEQDFLDRSGPDYVNQILQIAGDHLRKLTTIGGKMILPSMDEFPVQLTQIQDPPLGLNILGDFSILGRSTSVAVVGSRKSSGSSLETSFRFGKRLAESDHLVVSGGAYGCDIAAHRGVLTSTKPYNAAVIMAGGLDEFYPRGNLKTFAQILSHGGCIVSERLCFNRPRPYYFLVRNRIIAGLSQSIFVIQAAERSGALYTASRALDYGRDIYVSDNFQVGDLQYQGNTQLISDGANILSLPSSL